MLKVERVGSACVRRVLIKKQLCSLNGVGKAALSVFGTIDGLIV